MYTNRDPHPRTLIIRNRMAAVGWGFMTIWLVMVGMFTWLFFREGGMGQLGYEIEAAIVVVFWIAGIGGIAHFGGFPIIRVEREGHEIIVTERRLSGRTVRRLPLSGIADPVLTEGQDDEGSPYFRAVLTLPDGHRVTLAEGHDRETVQGKMRRVTEEFARAGM